MVEVPGYERLVLSVQSNSRTWAAVIMAIIVLVVVLIIYAIAERVRQDHFLGTNPLGNLNTGSNNPLPFMQMGDAGWGGSMHSTYQYGQPRVWAASATGPDQIAVVPVSAGSCSDKTSYMANGEAQALTALEGGDASAKSMSDEALTRIMNGGSNL